MTAAAAPSLSLEREQMPLNASPLTKKQIGKAYFDAWVMVRELQQQASPEAPLNEFTQRVINYVGYRFNLVWTGKTCFAPKPFVSTRRECWDCEGNGAISSRGYDPEVITSELCHPCRTQGWVGGRQDFERAL